MLHGEMKGSTAGGGPLAYISRPTFKFLERKACVAKVCHRSAVAVIWVHSTILGHVFEFEMRDFPQNLVTGTDGR